MSAGLPPDVLARFPDADPAVLAAPDGRALLIGRLLEEGDRTNLTWLVGVVGEPSLRAWIRTHGARRLSSRSERFWRLVLDETSDVGHGTAAAEAVWRR